jgi:Bacterial DNA-binding protein
MFFLFTSAENGALLRPNVQSKGGCGFPRVVRSYQTTSRELSMNKNELIAAVADAADLTKAKAAEAVDAFINCVAHARLPPAAIPAMAR